MACMGWIPPTAKDYVVAVGVLKYDHSLYDKNGLTLCRIVFVGGRYHLRTEPAALGQGIQSWRSLDAEGGNRGDERHPCRSCVDRSRIRGSVLGPPRGVYVPRKKGLRSARKMGLKNGHAGHPYPLHCHREKASAQEGTGSRL